MPGTAKTRRCSPPPARPAPTRSSRGLARGYGTLLDRRFKGGADLSGGQWQRLAVARGFFRDAPLLICDEPTAALDARAEHQLFERIRTHADGRTVLLITHRLASVRYADRIYVLERGEVIEEGDHAALMARGGLYADLYSCRPPPTRPRARKRRPTNGGGLEVEAVAAVVLPGRGVGEVRGRSSTTSAASTSRPSSSPAVMRCACREIAASSRLRTSRALPNEGPRGCAATRSRSASSTPGRARTRPPPP